jgi:hypothetical protein
MPKKRVIDDGGGRVLFHCGSGGQEKDAFSSTEESMTPGEGEPDSACQRGIILVKHEKALVGV